MLKTVTNLKVHFTWSFIEIRDIMIEVYLIQGNLISFLKGKISFLFD